ncbi:hypothetical protein ABOONEI_148 [Aciduliprofundum boonei T469]|nr:hypothetical protein ABOONEI_815 [Aciduliprofundum boonei T469]EDY35611.1 hypothetical protein ABOONEI_148 [Aciduliprofundum boonei T469]
MIQGVTIGGFRYSFSRDMGELNEDMLNTLLSMLKVKDTARRYLE